MEAWRRDQPLRCCSFRCSSTESVSAGRSTCCSIPPSGALGLVVLCGDESSRFLAFAAADIRTESIDLPSALVLLEDVDFYRDRSRSLRDLLGGELRDLLVARDGSVEALVIEQEGRLREIRPADAAVELERVPTA